MTAHRPSHRLVPRKPRGVMPDTDLWAHLPPPDDTEHSRPVDDDTIEHRFAAFHAAHPDVFAMIVELAQEAHDAGRTRLSMKLLVEVIRWNRFISHGDTDDFKINNVFTSRYTRLLQQQHPHLAAMFATRELRSA